MQQDWLLYSITLFTFAAIFLMCYIQHIFTYFQKKNIFLLSQPTFPRGNVTDVVSYNVPMFLKLWKYANRLKKKAQSFGGFFIYCKPAVLVVDPRLSEAIITSSCFGNARPGIEISSELWDQVIEEYLIFFRQHWQAIDQKYDNKPGNFSLLMEEIMIDCCIEKLFSPTQNFKDNENVTSRIRNTLQQPQIFTDLMSLSYPDNKICTAFFNRNAKIGQYFRNGEPKFNSEDSYSTEELFSEILQALSNATNSILYALYEIAGNYNIQMKLRQEIHSLTGEATEDPYLDAVICETLRKYPPHPFIVKICQKDYKLNDRVTFEKNILMFISTFELHHNPKNFSDPKEFEPERFLDSPGLATDRTRYLPFDQSAPNNFELFHKKIMKGVLKEILLSSHLNVTEMPVGIKEFSHGVFELRPKEDIYLKINRIE